MLIAWPCPLVGLPTRRNLACEMPEARAHFREGLICAATHKSWPGLRFSIITGLESGGNRAPTQGCLVSSRASQAGIRRLREASAAVRLGNLRPNLHRRHSSRPEEAHRARGCGSLRGLLRAFIVAAFAMGIGPVAAEEAPPLAAPWLAQARIGGARLFADMTASAIERNLCRPGGAERLGCRGGFQFLRVPDRRGIRDRNPVHAPVHRRCASIGVCASSGTSRPWRCSARSRRAAGRPYRRPILTGCSAASTASRMSMSAARPARRASCIGSIPTPRAPGCRSIRPTPTYFSRASRRSPQPASTASGCRRSLVQ